MLLKLTNDCFLETVTSGSHAGCNISLERVESSGGLKVGYDKICVLNTKVGVPTSSVPGIPMKRLIFCRTPVRK